MRNEELNRDIKVKKTLYPPITNQISYNSSYSNEQIGYSDQAKAYINKKDFCSHYDDNKGQSNNSLSKKVNIIMVKRNKKINKDLS